MYRHNIGDKLLQFELCLLNKNTTQQLHLEKLGHLSSMCVCVWEREREEKNPTIQQKPW